MKVLIDECLPKALKRFLCEHGLDCQTVQEAGWSGKRNGELLTLAEAAFEVFVTADANLQYQQNLKERKIAIVVLLSRSNRLDDMRPLFPSCADVVKKIQTGGRAWVG